DGIVPGTDRSRRQPYEQKIVSRVASRAMNACRCAGQIRNGQQSGQFAMTETINMTCQLHLRKDSEAKMNKPSNRKERNNIRSREMSYGLAALVWLALCLLSWGRNEAQAQQTISGRRVEVSARSVVSREGMAFVDQNNSVQRPRAPKRLQAPMPVGDLTLSNREGFRASSPAAASPGPDSPEVRAMAAASAPEA